MDNEWVRQFASLGFLLPTDRYFSGSLNGELLSNVLAQNEWNGFTWGVPLDVDPYVIVYNVNALKRLGFTSPPTSGQGWAKLIDDFHKQEYIPYLLSYDYDNPYAALTLLWQLNTSNFEGNALLEVTEGLKGTFQKLEHLRPKVLDSKGALNDEIWKLSYDEKLLFYLTKASEANGRSNNVLGVFYPQQEGKQRSLWMHGRSFVVPTQSDNAKKAGEWITAMTSLEDQARWFQATSHLPVIKSQYMNKSLPTWVPSSIVNAKAGMLPVYAKLPQHMIQYGRITSEFMRNSMNAKEYNDLIAKLFAQ
ncbi:hypothetical protein D3C77_374030 [compost metagenome]